MLDPFGYSPLRLAPGRDLYQRNLGPHGCLEPKGRFGAGRLNGSNGPTKLVHFITKRTFLMLDPFGYSPLRLAPGWDLYQRNLGPHGCLEPEGRPEAGRLNGSNGPTNDFGAFLHKKAILYVGTVRIFALTACPRTEPIPAQSRSPWVLGTRRSSWGRPSELVKWTNKIGAFHHKTYILDFGPVWIFAPTACPNTGPIPAQSRSSWLLRTRRPSWGRPCEWVKWTNEIGAFNHKQIFLMLDPFGYSPLRLAPGRDLYQPNLGPHGCLEPGGRPV